MPIRSPVLSGYLAGQQANVQEQAQGLQQLQGMGSLQTLFMQQQQLREQMAEKARVKGLLPEWQSALESGDKNRILRILGQFPGQAGTAAGLAIPKPREFLPLGAHGGLLPDPTAPGGYRRIEPILKPEKPQYKERNVSYDGRTYTREISRDNGITWEKIPGSQPVDIRKATGAADITIQTPTEGGEINVPGIGMQDKRDISKGLRQATVAVTDLRRFLNEVRQTPGAVGLRGEIGTPAAGLAGTFLGPKAGEVVSQAITGAPVANVRQVRTQAQLLRGKLLPIVTGETGRFTENERAIATETMAALDVTQSAEQVVAATKTLMRLETLSQDRLYRALGGKPKYDLSIEQGFVNQAKELRMMGFDDNESIAITKELRQIRGR